jgi:hypothetical protein
LSSSLRAVGLDQGRRLQLLFGQGNFKWLARAALDFSAIGRPTNPADRGQGEAVIDWPLFAGAGDSLACCRRAQKKSQRG